MTKLFFIHLILFFTLSFNLQAQNKRPMTVDDTKTWNRISNKIISPNGNYVAYRIAPNKGDGNLFLYNDSNKSTLKFERGKNAKLGFDNNLLIFKIEPQADSLRQKKLDKVKKDKLPKDSLGIYFFDKDSLIKVEKVKKYILPKKNSQWLAYLYDYKAPKDTTPTIDSTSTDSTKTKKKEFKQKGYRMLILNTQNLKSYIYENISEVCISEKAQTFVFSQNIKDSIDTAKVYLFDTQQAKEKLIFEKTGQVKKIAVDNLGTQISFLYSSDTTKAKKYNLWYYSSKSNTAKVILDTNSTFFYPHWGASENQSPYFSDSGQRLYFGIAPFPKQEPKDTLLDEEKVHLDLWSWTDKILQPQQLKNKEKDFKRTFKCFYNIKSKQFIQLEDSLTDVRVRKDIDASYFLGTSDYNYLQMLSWTPDYPSDYYIIEAKTGQKTLLAKQKIWYAYSSPSGKYTLAWDRETETWSITDNTTLQSINLTQNIDDIFYNDKHDTPSLRNSQRKVGWSEDEKWIYIYSQYDIWQFDVNGKKAPINLTKGEGKKTKIEYNFQKLDREAVYLPKEKWMLHSFNHKTKAEAYYWLNLKTLERTTLISENRAFYPPIKAQNANKLLWANSTFTDFPNLKLSNIDFTDTKTLTNANPQQDSILWGKVSLTKWTDFNGDTLNGLLILPENFDANKKYPVIIYFYEKYSDHLNRYWTPRPSHSTINFSFYASNGYIVFVPDINYGTGLPGKDAYNAVVSGTQYIKQFPFVNPDKIGLQGQSWGGYQVAYLITQTRKLYTCAMAGAPVSNMTSAYGGIRWASGMSRMFQYEHTQSRIGGTLWERRDKYIENSPVFFADRIQTPVLIMHNDGDGAVPWYQGIEYFVALRRLNKPAWLLNYNGDSHNLRKWPNRVDLTIRMFDFFEYYLKDKPMPLWMEKGLPAVKKGKELRY